MRRLTVLTIDRIIRDVLKWQKGTYEIHELERIVVIDHGKSRVRQRSIQNIVYDVQHEMQELYGDTFTTNYTKNTVELWF